MKHLLLTGATGFLGSHLLESFLQQGYKVTILKRTTSDTWRISHLLNQVSAIDIDTTKLESAFESRKIDVVVHTACNYGRDGETVNEVIETNLVFGLLLLETAIFYKTEIFINTDTLLPKYISTYSLSKTQFADWLKHRSFEIQVINLKLEHMYGPNDDEKKFVSWIINQLQKGVHRISLTEGNQLRDFVYIDDIVSAYLFTLKFSNQLGKFAEFDVGTGTLTSVRSFVTKIHKVFRAKKPDLNSVLGFGDLDLRSGEAMQVEVDNTELRKLGWSPKVSIEQGIKQTVWESK